MSRILRLAMVVAVVGAALMVSTAAWAQSAGKAPDFSAYPELEEVADELERMWHHEPERFAQLQELREAYVELGQRSGQRPVPAARMLQTLGDEALLPMLWHLVSENPMELGMGLRTWRNWRVGLVEAVGRIRDERSVPVLHSIVIANNPYDQLRTVATTAIGRTGNVEAIDALIEEARSSEDKTEAIIAGLGKARRHNSAEYLLEVAQSAQEGHQVAAVRALGDWANQWAWETPQLEPYSEERPKVVSAIVTALVDLYPHVEGRLATEIEKSLQLASAQASKERAQARATQADGAKKERLERLIEVMERSPLD